MGSGAGVCLGVFGGAAVRQESGTAQEAAERLRVGSGLRKNGVRGECVRARAHEAAATNLTRTHTHTHTHTIQT